VIDPDVHDARLCRWIGGQNVRLIDARLPMLLGDKVHFGSGSRDPAVPGLSLIGPWTTPRASLQAGARHHDPVAIHFPN
jgi:hypothetical protein